MGLAQGGGMENAVCWTNTRCSTAKDYACRRAGAQDCWTPWATFVPGRYVAIPPRSSPGHELNNKLYWRCWRNLPLALRILVAADISTHSFRQNGFQLKAVALKVESIPGGFGVNPLLIGGKKLMAKSQLR